MRVTYYVNFLFGNVFQIKGSSGCRPRATLLKIIRIVQDEELANIVGTKQKYLKNKTI